MSYFRCPISTVRDADGSVISFASVLPYSNMSVSQLYKIISTDASLTKRTDELRHKTSPNDIRLFKATALPFVTPFGTFSRRRGDALVNLSGLVPIDVDHLPSYEEACRLRDVIFEDKWLNTQLCFVSPSGLGVKAFVPYRLSGNREADINLCREATLTAMEYVSNVYAPPTEDPKRGVDRVGRDLARACFLCHDANALCAERKKLTIDFQN